MLESTLASWVKWRGIMGRHALKLICIVGGGSGAGRNHLQGEKDVMAAIKSFYFIKATHFQRLKTQMRKRRKKWRLNGIRTMRLESTSLTQFV